MFADRVKEATNGELEIVVHFGGALGFKGPELLRAVAEGQIAIAKYAAPFFPLMLFTTAVITLFPDIALMLPHIMTGR